MNLPRRFACAGFSLLFALVGNAQSNQADRPTTRPAESGSITTDDREKRMKAENDAIGAALEKKIESFELDKTPLDTAIEKLIAQTAVRNHHVEWQTLVDSGVPRDKPISLRLRGASAWRVLDLLLGEAGGADISMAYEPIDGVLHISTTEGMGQRMSIRVYPVGDILMRDLLAMRARTSMSQPADEPLPGESADVARAEGHFRAALKRLDDAAGETSEEPSSDDERPRTPKAYRLNKLIELTTETVHPDCWAQNGGTSTLRVFEDCLVVRSNPRVHREICRLLSDLRAGILETPAESRKRGQKE